MSIFVYFTACLCLSVLSVRPVLWFVNPYTCMFVSHFVCLSICLYVCMFVSHFVCLSVCLYSCMSSSLCPCAFLSVFQAVSRSVCLSVGLFADMYICYLSVSLTACWHVCITPICMSLCLFVCLSVCLFVRKCTQIFYNTFVLLWGNKNKTFMYKIQLETI